MKTIIGIAVLLMLPVTAVVADEKADAAWKLDGTYEVIELLVNGKPLPRKEGVKQTVTIKDGTIALMRGDEKSEPAAFTLDSSKKPAHIDMLPPKRLGVDVVKGIYMTQETDKGLELIIAHHTIKVGVRPTDFKGEGEGLAVMRLLRQKV
jgi:uncharacterized protein (TIGR03067 family)